VARLRSRGKCWEIPVQHDLKGFILAYVEAAWMHSFRVKMITDLLTVGGALSQRDARSNGVEVRK